MKRRRPTVLVASPGRRSFPMGLGDTYVNAQCSTITTNKAPGFWCEMPDGSWATWDVTGALVQPSWLFTSLLNGSTGIVATLTTPVGLAAIGVGIYLLTK